MTHRAYRFGDYRLDPATRVLSRGDTPVSLPSKAFDCLVYLVENRARAVGRDELIAAVWGKVDIGDNVLGQTVLFARRAIEDTGKEQNAIRTIVRYGYHWVAPIEIEAGGAPEAVEVPAPVPTPAPAPAGVVEAPAPVAAEPLPATAPPSRRRLYGLLALLAVVAIALVASLAWQPTPEPAPPGPAAPKTKNLLVLPAQVTGDEEAAWARLGVMDLVASRLRAANLGVVPSDNVVAYTRGLEPHALRTESLRNLTEATGAGIVIDAQAEAIDGSWRVSLRTVHGREPPIDVQEHSPDLLGAARLAADRLARQLGGAPPPGETGTLSEPAFGALLQQVDAAMLSDRLDTAQALLERASAEQRQRPETRLRLAQIHYQAGRLDSARAAFNELAASVSAEADPVLHARAIYGLGVLAMTARDAAAALPRFNTAIGLLQGRGVPAILGRALSARAGAYATVGDFDAAMVDTAAARVAYESADDGLALAVLDANVGALELLRDRPAEAASALDRAIARFAAFRMHAAELNARDAAAHARLMLLDPRAALALDARMQELANQVADPQRRLGAELTRVEVLAANGQKSQAGALLARVVADEALGAELLARADAIAARIAYEDGNYPEAARRARTALPGLPDSDDNRTAVRLRLTLLRAQLRLGEDAEPTAAAIDEWAARVRTPSAAMLAKLARADVAAQADKPSADAAYRAALSLADQNRIPIDLLLIAQGYADWLATHLDPVRAGVLAERLGAWADHDYDAALQQLRLYHALGQNAAWRSALDRCRRNAGERKVPAPLLEPPSNRP